MSTLTSAARPVNPAPADDFEEVQIVDDPIGDRLAAPHVKPAPVLLCDGTPEIEIIEEPVPTPAGVKLGFPPGFPAEAAAIDAQVYGRMRCPSCRKRMTFTPRHRGTLYVPVCRCVPCGHTEQL